MVVKTTRIGRDPAEVFEYAASTIHDFLAEELGRATDATVATSKSLAPVYKPAKYPNWAHMKHAREPHGLLKASIKHTPVKQTPTTMKTSIYSRRRYSVYVEEGFRHAITQRPVRGRRYVEIPVETVHKHVFPRGTVRAFKRAFKEGI